MSGAAGTLALAEMAADKIPAFDSYGTVPDLIRIPAGAVLAALPSGDTDPAWMVAAGLLGGTITAGTSFCQGRRPAGPQHLARNCSATGASLGEEGLVVGGFALLVAHPGVFPGSPGRLPPGSCLAPQPRGARNFPTFRSRNWIHSAMSVPGVTACDRHGFRRRLECSESGSQIPAIHRTRRD